MMMERFDLCGLNETCSNSKFHFCMKIFLTVEPSKKKKVNVVFDINIDNDKR